MNDSEKAIRQHYAAMAPRVLEALRNRGYEAWFCADAKEAREKVLELILPDDTVSWGGSMTMEELGVISRLRAGGYKLIDRDAAATREERAELMRQALLCGTFLASVNAMTEDGVMINIDGNCNRIAAIAYGPKRVVLAVGMNKICRDLPSARSRARCFAAPANAMRLNLEDRPCFRTGVCCDCHAGTSICAQVVEMRCNHIPGRIKVVLIGENSGL